MYSRLGWLRVPHLPEPKPLLGHTVLVAARQLLGDQRVREALGAALPDLLDLLLGVPCAIRVGRLGGDAKLAVNLLVRQLLRHVAHPVQRVGILGARPALWQQVAEDTADAAPLGASVAREPRHRQQRGRVSACLRWQRGRVSACLHRQHGRVGTCLYRQRGRVGACLRWQRGHVRVCLRPLAGYHSALEILALLKQRQVVPCVLPIRLVLGMSELCATLCHEQHKAWSPVRLYWSHRFLLCCCTVLRRCRRRFHIIAAHSQFDANSQFFAAHSQFFAAHSQFFAAHSQFFAV
eukprot:3306891-Prymnesium_polylepis.1